MKIKVVLFLVLLTSICAQAKPDDKLIGLLGANIDPSEFAAPVIYSRTGLSNPVAGEIVYDGSGSGAFYGLIPNSDPTSSSSWIQLGGSATGGNTVLSTAGSTERLQRASVSCTSGGCSINDISGNPSTPWLSVARASAGNYTLTYNSGFSQSPDCTATTNQLAGSDVGTCFVSSTSASAGSMQCGSGNTLIDVGFNIICMGPQ